MKIEFQLKLNEAYKCHEIPTAINLINKYHNIKLHNSPRKILVEQNRKLVAINFLKFLDG